MFHPYTKVLYVVNETVVYWNKIIPFFFHIGNLSYPSHHDCWNESSYLSWNDIFWYKDKAFCVIIVHIRFNDLNNFVVYSFSFRLYKHIVRGNKNTLPENFLQVDLKTLSIKFFYKVILSLMMVMIKHSRSDQSKKLAIALQYLKN